MYYEDPIENASRGAVKGTLDWGTEAIKKLATKFREKQLAFIQDKKTIDIVKEQLRSGNCLFTKNISKTVK
jgi:hypothetical protein